MGPADVLALLRAVILNVLLDYDGYLSSLIEPVVSNDEQKSFFVSGTAERLELF